MTRTIAVPAPSESVLVPQTVVVTPAKVAEPQAEKPKPAAQKVEVDNVAPAEPFFGRPPDDPGVRETAAAEKANFRLF